MKNNYPRNFVNKILTKIRNKQQSNIPDEQPEQSRTRTTLPNINSTSEMTARLFRKDKTASKQTKNAIYMIPCRDCPQRYICQISKKIEIRITEHKNDLKRYDYKSLPAAHTYHNCHTFH